MSNIMSLEQYQLQVEQQNIRHVQVLQCKNQQELKHQHKLIYQQYHKNIKLNWENEYVEQRGWGVVKPIVDLKKIASLCKYPYRRNSVKGCTFCNKKRYWYDIIDPNQDVYALYFSMDLVPLWTKLRKRWPHWTTPQVQNNRYWRATKHKLLKVLELEFLETHPGLWCRAMNRAPGHITYTFAIHYNVTMEQIGVYLRWPPEPYPITIQFLGRPKPGVDHSWGSFILSEESIKKFVKRQVKKVEPMSLAEEIDQEIAAANLSSADFQL